MCVTAAGSLNCVSTECIDVFYLLIQRHRIYNITKSFSNHLGDSVVIEVNNSFINYWWNTANFNDINQHRVVCISNLQDFIYVVEAIDSNGCESKEEIEVFVDTCVTTVAEKVNMKI